MTNATEIPASTPRRHVPRGAICLLIALLGSTALSVLSIAPTAAFVATSEGLIALAIIVSAIGWGAFPAAWLTPPTGATQSSSLQRVVLAAALGLGLLGFLTLGLGVIGLLTRATAWTLVLIGLVLGIAALFRELAGKQRPAVASPNDTLATCIALAVIGLVLGAPLGLTLCGASLPPGLIWSEEGKGYDALIYHLQVQREYYDAGRIHFLPHNVYASFPQQVEILYLLAMHLSGGAVAGAIPAQWLHAGLGVLAVLAIAAAAPRGAGRWTAALAAAGIPWLAYVGCLAYVELGTLFFAAVAAGLLLNAARDDGSDDAQPGAARPTSWRHVLTAGLCAGLAGGTKYTAIALVAAALGVAWLIAMRGALSRRARLAAVFALGVSVTLAPWLIRNTAFTGNPVYPFAYRWFGGAAWSAAQDAQWARGHRPPPVQASLTGRIRTAWNEILASPMFAPVFELSGLRIPLLPAVLAALFAATIRTRAGVLLWLWALFVALIWATTTHMPGRFAMPAIVPVAIAAGRACDRLRSRAARVTVVTGATFVAIAGMTHLGIKWRTEDLFWSERGAPLAALVGRTDVLQSVQPINAAVPPDGFVWMVGDARAFYLTPRTHYTVVFNRDPWLSLAEHATPADAVAWLRTQNVTHVVFSWPEIDRLHSYEFPGWVTRAWVAQLRQAGLRRVGDAVEADPDVEILAVPPS